MTAGAARNAHSIRIVIIGFAAGRSQRSSRTSCASGRLTQPAVAGRR